MKMYRPHRLCPRNSKPKEPSLYRSLCVSILCMFLSTVMLVGTTFAWFHSSAVSAVSTITAGLNATASFVTQEMVNSTKDGDSLSWIPFDSYSVNPFGSIPLSSNNAKVVFLKLENKSSSDIVYRFALNLLDDTSTDYSLSNALYFGFENIGSLFGEVTEKNFLSDAHIPGMSTGADGTPTFTFPATGSDGSPVDSVDCLYEHRCTDVQQDPASNISTVTYGGKVHDVTVSSNSTIYVALSLYTLNSTISNDYISIQLAMAVGQSELSEQLQPNVVKYYTPPTVRNSEESSVEPMSSEQDSDNSSSEESSIENPPVPELPTPADQQPTTGTNTTETPTPPETPSGSTTGTEGTTGTSESGDTGTTGTTGTTSDTSGGGDTTVTENGSET